MRTHGHREGNTTQWGVSGGTRGGTAVGGELGSENMGRNAMCVRMQQSCMFFTCTPKPKMQLKNKNLLQKEIK